MSDEAELVMTNHSDLRNAIFLDGRERFWSERMLIAKDELELITEPVPTSFIFHIGFCGSTLLARLLDLPGSRFVLKEPQALSDLASQWPHADHCAENLGIVTGALSRSGPEGEVTIVKPSCWANPLIPHLVSSGLVARAIFLTLDWRSYLTACFRGGRDRLAYCARMAESFATHDGDKRDALSNAIVESNDPLDQTARMILLLHAWQLEMFKAAELALDENRARSCVFQCEGDSVRQKASELARFLTPNVDPELANSGVDFNQHAKDPTTRFSDEAQNVANAEILRHHRERFDAAHAWFQKSFSN